MIMWCWLLVNLQCVVQYSYENIFNYLLTKNLYVLPNFSINSVVSVLCNFFHKIQNAFKKIPYFKKLLCNNRIRQTNTVISSVFSTLSSFLLLIFGC